LPPALAVLTDTNDDIETVVTSIQALTVALRTVADESEGIILEVVLELRERPVTSLVNNLLGASKVEGLYAPNSGLYACNRQRLSVTLIVFFYLEGRFA
jgi:hypothetical protein